MIQVENLCLAYSGNPVLQGISFTINPGERCALVGRNGSGKTTLFRLLVGQETPDSGTISLSRGYKLGYLDQHIRFSRPTILEEAVQGLPEAERDYVYKAEMMLNGLGFKEEDMDLPPQQLSGGYQLRLHLAKVLLSEPDCLLLDEPTNYLDILSIRFLMGFLAEWKGELVLISHDREFMDAVTTHTFGIHRNKIKKVKGSTIDYFTYIMQEEEIYEKTRQNLEKKREHLQSFVERFGAKASKAAQAQSKQKMLDRIPALEALANLYQLDFNFREAPFPGKKMLEIKHVSFGYEPEKDTVIDDFSLTIERGERIAIIGKNGYGKSTLLRLCAGELKPQSGEISSSEQTSIGYFGQTHIQRLTETRSIEEEIAATHSHIPYSDVKRICGQMMFSGDISRKKIGVLSGGEKSRVLLGKILAKPCNLLLLDEPTHHLDIESVEALIDALEDFKGAFVIVTHSELILKRLQLDKLVVCHLGKQEHFLGGYEEFLEKVGWEEEQPTKPKPPKIKPPPRNLKSLEQDIQRLEKSIVASEEQLLQEQQLLIEATEKKDVPKIQELVKKIEEREKAIYSLYEQLMKCSDEKKKQP